MIRIIIKSLQNYYNFQMRMRIEEIYSFRINKSILLIRALNLAKKIYQREIETTNPEIKEGFTCK